MNIKNPILLNKMMEDLVQAVSPEKMQAVHAKLDAILDHLGIAVPAGGASPEQPPPPAEAASVQAQPPAADVVAEAAPVEVESEPHRSHKKKS